MLYAMSALLDIKLDLIAYLIVILSAFGGYNLNRIVEVEKDVIDHSERAYFFMKYKKHLTVLTITSIILAFLLTCLKGRVELIIIVSLPLIFVILYTIHWIPKSITRYRRLKDIIIIKNVTPAVGWATGTVLMPIFYVSGSITPSVVLAFLFVFLRIFIGSIVHDAKDVKGDRIHKVETLCVVLGLKKTKLFLIGMNSIMVILFLFITFIGLLPALMYILLIGSSLYVYAYLYFLDKPDINLRFLSNIAAPTECVILAPLAFVGKNLV